MKAQDREMEIIIIKIKQTKKKDEMILKVGVTFTSSPAADPTLHFFTPVITPYVFQMDGTTNQCLSAV